MKKVFLFCKSFFTALKSSLMISNSNRSQAFLYSSSKLQLEFLCNLFWFCIFTILWFILATVQLSHFSIPRRKSSKSEEIMQKTMRKKRKRTNVRRNEFIEVSARLNRKAFLLLSSDFEFIYWTYFATTRIVCISDLLQWTWNSFFQYIFKNQFPHFNDKMFLFDYRDERIKIFLSKREMSFVEYWGTSAPQSALYSKPLFDFITFDSITPKEKLCQSRAQLFALNSLCCSSAVPFHPRSMKFSLFH